MRFLWDDMSVITYIVICIPSLRAISRIGLSSSTSHRFNPTGTGSMRLSITAAIRHNILISSRLYASSYLDDMINKSMSLQRCISFRACDPNNIPYRTGMPCFMSSFRYLFADATTDFSAILIFPWFFVSIYQLLAEMGGRPTFLDNALRYYKGSFPLKILSVPVENLFPIIQRA